MTSKNQAADIVREFETEPPAAAVDQLLEAGRSFDGLVELTEALSESPRPWSARLIVLAAIRLSTTDPPAEAKLSLLGFDLLRIIRPLGDWPASAGCLDLMKRLIEDGYLESRSAADRQALVDVLWSCIRDDHPNARSSSVHFLEALIDFGQSREVLSGDDLRSVCREAEQLQSAPASGEKSGDLARFVALARAVAPPPEDG